MAFPIEDAIQLRAQQCAERGDVEPDQGCDAGAKRAIEHGVVGNARDIPSEGQRGREPEQRGGQRARPHPGPVLLAAGAKVIEGAQDTDACDEGDGPSRHAPREEIGRAHV